MTGTKVAEVLLVLGVLFATIGIIQALKLIAAQRAGIAMQVRLLPWLYPSAALFIGWVVLR